MAIVFDACLFLCNQRRRGLFHLPRDQRCHARRYGTPASLTSANKQDKLFNDASVAPTPSDPETRSLANANGGRDLESAALLSPSLRGRRDSDLSAASEPPDFTPEEAEDLLNRGSISRQMIKSMFTGERPSRSPSRSRSPGKAHGPDIDSPLRNQNYQPMDGDRDFEIDAD